MKISIIVPVYNTAKYLPRCVDSLINQSYGDIEIILVNDGSQDACRDICRRLCQKDSRIKYIFRENGGISAARNTGIDAAVGEYLCFVDSDDCVSPFYIEKLLKMCTENGTKIARCGYVINDEDTLPENVPVPLVYHETEVIDQRDYFLRIYTPKEIIYITPWNKIYHKSLFENLRYREGMINEDDGIIHRIIDRCEKIALCYVPLYFYTVREGSIMTTPGFSPAKADILSMWQDREEYFHQRGMEDLAFLTRKNYMVKCLELYCMIDSDTPDGKMWKKHLAEAFAQKLSRAGQNPAKSRKFLLKMAYYKLNPSAFRGVRREDILFK